MAGDPARLGAQVTSLVAAGRSVTLCSATAGGAVRLSGVLAEEGVLAPVVDLADPAPGARVVVAALSAGFDLREAGVAVLAESDVTGRRAPHRTARPRARPTDGFFDDLEPGSFVVHRQHGVARYAGMTTRTVGGTSRDYLLLEYRGSDRLYLPVDQIEAVTPYSGGESPTLSKMGGAEWQRTRARARAAAGEIAEELVALYRQRLAVEGHAFAPDTPWQHEMESAFPHVETADQTRAVAEVKADMEQPRPMDRLVCGDVGFGKTEVAVRAVFKAVQDSKQAAVLVPTTLLASQHFLTFSDRYAGFPVRVELLSRFLSAAQAKKVVDGLADGSVDVVVGTHRLLAADVRFKDLGLLVVDEEQRFGVTHKEAVKRMSEGVDVLTLTASPIPRTLEMALTGIRDLSMVNTPPADRRPILTYVGETDEAAVSEALRRELLREGQVFYVHNRVADIDAVARRLRGPGPRGPGRRGPRPDGRGQPRADRHRLLGAALRRAGLHDDHRVGHRHADGQHAWWSTGPTSSAWASCTSCGAGSGGPTSGPTPTSSTRRTGSSPSRPTSGCARSASTPSSARGSRSPCATSRSAGPATFSARDQSGHIAAVGYDLYVQLVAEAVAEARGEARPAPPTVSLDVPGDAHLPAAYVARRGRPPRGLPPAGRGHHPRARSTTWPTSGPTGSGPRRRPPRGCWP